MYYFIDKIEAAIITWAVLEARCLKRIVGSGGPEQGNIWGWMSRPDSLHFDPYLSILAAQSPLLP